MIEQPRCSLRSFLMGFLGIAKINRFINRRPVELHYPIKIILYTVHIDFTFF